MFSSWRRGEVGAISPVSSSISTSTCATWLPLGPGHRLERARHRDEPSVGVAHGDAEPGLLDLLAEDVGRIGRERQAHAALGELYLVVAGQPLAAQDGVEIAQHEFDPVGPAMGLAEGGVFGRKSVMKWLCFLPPGAA
jgi:hypothetical protein